MENKSLDYGDSESVKTVQEASQEELDRLIDCFDTMVQWIDMCKVFETVPIVVRGSFRFKLKHIGNAFYNNGLIDTHWTDGRMSDGFRAMLEAIKLYRLNKPMSKNEEMYKEIIDYNEIDCRVIWEIVNYLRLNH
jgi:predicted RecB family nuclease